MRATVEELVSRWKGEWRQLEDGTPLKNDPEPKSGVGPHPRLGIGLAMSNIFARYGNPKIYIDERKTDLRRYFGGSLDLVSLDGWGEIVQRFDMYHPNRVAFQGTDVYLRLPKLVSQSAHTRCLIDETPGHQSRGD